MSAFQSAMCAATDDADKASALVTRGVASLLGRLDSAIGFEHAARLIVHESACQLATDIGCREAAIHLREIAAKFDGGANV